MFGDDIEHDYHEIEIKTNYPISESFTIYYLDIGKKIKGKADFSNTTTTLENLKLDRLATVAVDTGNIYFYGLELTDGHFAKYDIFLKLADIERITIVE